MEITTGNIKHYVFAINMNESVMNKRNILWRHHILYIIVHRIYIHINAAPDAIYHHETLLADVVIHYTTYIIVFAAVGFHICAYKQLISNTNFIVIQYHI